MKKVGIIGHVDHGKTTLSAALQTVLEEQEIKTGNILEQGKDVYEFTNPYHFLDSRSPSKSQLKKCEKGLHEFSETSFKEETELGFRKLWACKNCGTFMHNR